MLPSTMSIQAGWLVDSQKSVLPQVEQKVRVPCSEER